MANGIGIARVFLSSEMVKQSSKARPRFPRQRTGRLRGAIGRELFAGTW